MRESKLERKAKEWAEDNGWLTMKYTGEKGYPDRIFIKEGVTVWMELKAPGRELSPMQHYRLRVLRDAGARAHWNNCLAGVQDTLNRHDPSRSST